MIESSAFASLLVDQAVVNMLMPWPCPSPFGPDGRYCLEELVGAGSNSLVYRATDLKLCSTGFQATVAIKISRGGDNNAAEALTARRIVHPNVIRVLDRGVEPGGAGYIITEYVQGGDLQTQPGPWEVRKAVGFMAKLARAVHAAHSAGVVHCDLKPANVLLTPDGEPKLADFDLSHSSGSADDRARGNMAFMSPEQFARDPEGLTPPADVYALGGMLYWLLTGSMANGNTPEQVAESHRLAAAPPSPRIDVDLDRICIRALARKREDRYESAAALANDLDRWLAFEPLPWGTISPVRRFRLWSRRHPYHATGALALAVVLVAAASVGTVMARSAEREQQTRIQAQAESVRKTNEEVEKLKAKMRAHIRSIAQGVMGRQGDQQERMLPTLTWLQWIADTPVLGNDGEVALAPKRIQALRAMIHTGEQNNRDSDVDVKLARYALVYFLVLDGQSPAAADILRQVKADWAGLRPEDPLATSIAAIGECIDAETDTIRPASERLTALAKVEERLRLSEIAEPARRLVARVIQRIRREGEAHS
jgi:hypothetical protein